MMRRFMVGGMSLLFGAGCARVSEAGDEPAKDRQVVSDSAQSLSTVGIRRVIPVRVLRFRDCTSANATGTSCYSNSSYPQALESVQAANQAFRSAGIQFWLRAYDDVEAPHFWQKYADTSGLSWCDVRDELLRVYPDMPASGYSCSFTPESDWLKIAVNLYAKPDEITVVLQGDSSAGCAGDWPWYGRGIWCGPNGMSSGKPYLFAHELGHYFGLPHAFSPDNGARAEDFWDQFYAPGSGSAADPPIDNTFFSNKPEIRDFIAAYPDAELRSIAQYPDSGRNYHQLDDRGAISVDLTGRGARENTVTTYESGSDALKGLSFPISHPDWDFGVNAMLYYSNETFVPTPFSRSQIEVIWSYMNGESRIRDAHRLSDGDYPAGYPGGIGSQQSYRARLGIADAWSLAPQVDFDGDARRDIAVWIAPESPSGTGHFSVRLSSRDWTGTTLEIDFGGLGDTPVLADYDGDGKTDIAVFQPGGGIDRNDPSDRRGYWRWCRSSAYTSIDVMTCTASSALRTLDFGMRDSLPLPGLDFDGDPSTPELAVYRKDATTNRGHFSFRPVSGNGTYTDVTLGSWSAVPLPGLYDDDERTDLVVYNRHTAAFELKLSSQSYGTTIVRQFSKDYIPREGSGELDSPGAYPLAGMMSLRNGKPRRAIAVWFPHDGRWSIGWDPAASSSTHTCSWGSDGETPLAGIDRNRDGRSDFAIIQPDDGAGRGVLHIKTASSSGCSGSTSRLAQSYFRGSDRTPAVVSDMTGDTYPELLVVDPSETNATFYYSDDGYRTRKSRSAFDVRAMLL
jgi:hypothetical protein